MSFFLLSLYMALTYVRVTDFYPELASYRLMLVLGSLSLAAALVTGLARQRVSIINLQAYLMAAFSACIAFSLLMQGWIGGTIEALESFGTTAGLVFFLIVLNVDSRVRLRMFSAVLAVLSLSLVVQAILAYHIGYMADLLILRQEVGGQDFDERVILPRVRSLGFLNDPNDFALALVVILPIIALAWDSRRKFRSVLVVGLPWLAILYCIYLTRSRGALFGIAVVCLMTFRKRFGRAGAGVLTAIVVAGLLAQNFSGGREFSAEDESAESRLDAWAVGISLLKDNPLAGVGFGMFTEHHERTAHNSMVLCFSELGLPGYFFWLALPVVTLTQLSSLLMRDTRIDMADGWASSWADALRTSLLAFFAQALFLSRTYSTTLYIVLGLASAFVNVANAQGIPIRIRSGAWIWKTVMLEIASIGFIYIVIRVGNL